MVCRSLTLLALMFLAACGAGGSNTAPVTAPPVAVDPSIRVSSIAALTTALSTAAPGAVIILADGAYADAPIVINRRGVRVQAATPGGVTLSGRATVRIMADSTVLSGFQFRNVNIGTDELIVVDGNFNTITECNIVGAVASKYVHFDGGYHHNELSMCNIEGKPGTMNAGPSVHISTSPTVINASRVRMCTFMNSLGAGGDFGNEPIRIGLGAEQDNVSAAVIEENYFENTGLGDSETISVKSRGNVIRHNTQNNNPLGSFVLRTGSFNSVYGNFFLRSGGVRVKEGNHQMIHNNYFEGAAPNSSLELQNQDVNPLDTIYVYHNTFFNPGPILFGGAGANPPRNVVVANNIFFKTSGTLLGDLNVNVTFVSNIFNGAAALGRPSGVSEFAIVNPLLQLTGAGIYGLAAGSPAVNAASAQYAAIISNPYVTNDPSMLFDVEGKSRPLDRVQKDIGGVELNPEPPVFRPLTRATAGPSYLRAQFAR